MKKHLLKFYMSSVSVLIFACIGILIGYLHLPLIDSIAPIGTVFIKLIKMPLVIVIFVFIVNAIINVRADGQFLKLGTFTISYFFLNNFLAGLLGVAIAFYLHPGLGITGIPPTLLTLSDELKKITAVKMTGFWDFIIDVIPSNLFEVFQQGKLISIVFFSLIFGISVYNIQHPKKQNFIDLMDFMSTSLMWIIQKVMYLAPIAVCVLLACFVSTAGVGVIVLVAKLIGVMLLAGLIWVYVICGLFIILFSPVQYFQFIKSIFPAQLIALGTASSMVTFPTTLKSCDEMNVSRDIASFVVALGSNLNSNGSAYYYCVFTVFFAQMFGIHLTFTTILLMAIMTVIGSMHPGIPGLSLTVVLVLMIANVPLIGLPLMIAIDRVLDPFITMINVAGNITASVLTDNFLRKFKKA